MPTEIHITEGDITEMGVDAIVNAANRVRPPRASDVSMNPVNNGLLS